MNKSNKDFNTLIKEDRYQVFIFSCPAYFPFSFARHPWFVLNKKGIVSRWEIRHYKNKNFNYLYINTQYPFKGVNLTFFLKKYFWKSKMVGCMDGDEDSTAQKIIEFIENSEKKYPYVFKYFFSGPNSNTYIQWVLDQFHEFDVKLSWNFIGKNFKIK